MRRHGRAARVGLEALMLVLAAVFVLPFAILVKVAVTGSDLDTAVADPSREPGALGGVGLSNFATAWTEAALAQALANSAIVAGLSVLCLMVFGSSAAYVLARRSSRLSTWLYVTVLLGLMIPPQLAMVPLYQLMSSAGLLRTYTSLIIFNTGSQLPFTIFLYAGFIRTLPRDYEEAASLDGASAWQRFTKIVFPLLRPITATVVILDLIDVWKDFLTPLLYVGGSAQQTLPVAIYAFRGEYSTQWRILFAGIIIPVLPVLVVSRGAAEVVIQGFAGGPRG